MKLASETGYAYERYVKVHVGPRLYYFMEVTSKRGNALYGHRVDDHGERWDREKGGKIEEHMILCHERDVVQELRLSLHYGTLEPCKNEFDIESE